MFDISRVCIWDMHAENRIKMKQTNKISLKLVYLPYPLYKHSNRHSISTKDTSIKNWQSCFLSISIAMVFSVLLPYLRSQFLKTLVPCAMDACEISYRFSFFAVFFSNFEVYKCLLVTRSMYSKPSVVIVTRSFFLLHSIQCCCSYFTKVL